MNTYFLFLFNESIHHFCFLFSYQKVKGNRVIPNAHFHKDWVRRVRTWFDQPAQAKIRNQRRKAKAQKLAPRPTENLRPVVRCPTVKYNRKVRAGRGFTPAELKEAGIQILQAPTIGITVDHRRHNRSQEGFNANVQRLKEYKAKLIIFPRKASKAKKGDASTADQQLATQVSTASVFPIRNIIVQPEPRVITKAERESSAFVAGRKAMQDQKLKGKRVKAAKEKADAAAKAAKKESKAGADDD